MIVGYWVLLAIALATWSSWIQTRLVLVVLLLFFAPKLAWLVFAYATLLFRTRYEMSALAVPVSPRPVDEPGIQSELTQASTAASPPWVKEAVDDWLATATGEEKNRKRAALLDRLYSYAATSTDDYAARSAVNQLRLAINPWVKD
jgi:hypothetical protein